MKTKFPEIAKEVDGWDPKTIGFSTNKKLKWLCSRGHSYPATVGERTGRDKTGCPYCANQKVLVGFNDFKTVFPEIAAEAHDWDPSSAVPGSSKNRNWICSLGHTYTASLAGRTGSRKGGCTYCAGKKAWAGFNDLQTFFPEIAKEADGWDPQEVTQCSAKKFPWICAEGHSWKSTVGNRTLNGTGCPECAVTGFNPGMASWFYLLERLGEQQFGITNHIEDRLKHHSRFGWSVIEMSGPHDGEKVQRAEAFLKKWLRKEIGLIPGTTENWQIEKLEVASLMNLKSVSGLKTEIF